MIYIIVVTAAAAKLLQSCPTLCDPIDSSPPGSSVSGILQARTLEWVAISFSNAWKWKVKVKLLSRVWLFSTPRTTCSLGSSIHGISRQEYWSGLPLPSPIVVTRQLKFTHLDEIFVTLFISSFWPPCGAFVILVSQPRIEPRPSAVKAES